MGSHLAFDVIAIALFLSCSSKSFSPISNVITPTGRFPRPRPTPLRHSIFCTINVYLIRSSICTDTTVIITASIFKYSLSHFPAPYCHALYSQEPREYRAQKSFATRCYLTDFCVGIVTWQIEQNRNQIASVMPTHMPTHNGFFAQIYFALDMLPLLFQMWTRVPSSKGSITKGFIGGCHGYPKSTSAKARAWGRVGMEAQANFLKGNILPSNWLTREPLLSGQLAQSRGWPPNRGLTV